jgi:hypothetical protein
MPRIRTLKPEFFTSPDVGAVDFPVRIFYQALWCWADDFGIGETNLNGLLGFAFPDSDGFSAQDLRRFCADCAQHFGITFYTVRGRHYYAIKSWDAHQKTERREQRRKHPTPDDPDATPDQRIHGCAESAPTTPRTNGAESREMCAGTGEQGNRGTGESLVTYVSGEIISEAPAKPPPSKKKGTRISGPDWMPQQKTVDRIKAAFPHISSEQLRNEHELFICWATSSASSNAVKLDWDATWSGWMRRELVKMPSHNGTNGKPHKLRALADLAAEVREMETTNGKALEA